jgi:hypothetical protein
MARKMDISMYFGEGKHPRPHIHGIEPEWSSKFWALGDDDESSVDSEDDDIEVPTLVEEAIAAGFSIDHLRQAEEELSSPSNGSTKVCAKLKEGSISKKVVELWISNRQNKAEPWTGPLPTPRKSPPRTLGDALANPKFKSEKKALVMYASKDRHCGGNLTQSLPDYR